MNHTLDSLAIALRGMPRDASILIETPDGLRPLVLVSATHVAEADGSLQAVSGGGRYAIVLHAGDEQPRGGTVT